MSGDYLPYRALGLSANPFRVLTPRELLAVTVVPGTLREACCEAGGHVQLIGEAGRGKTTLLRALAAELAGSGRAAAYEYLPEGARSYRTRVSSLDVLLLDEADRLARASWRRLLGELRSGATRLVFSAHADQARRFSKRGLELRTVVPARLLDRERLAAILAARVAPFKLPRAAGVTFSDAAVDWLFARFGSDLRTLESFLFDYFQSLRGSPAPLEPTASPSHEGTTIEADQLAAFGGRPEAR